VEHRLVGADLVTDPLVQAALQQWNEVVVGEVPDTLLGPEGSDDAHRLLASAGGNGVCRLVSSGRGPRREHGLSVLGVGCRLYFENFTVDASIFVVFKFLRAHGGCLGTRNRRRT
jgi:hypothetical protein